MPDDRFVARWMNGICLAAVATLISGIAWLVLARRSTDRFVGLPAPRSDVGTALRSATLAERSGDYASARRQFAKALRLSPKSPSAKLGVARMALLTGDLAEAWNDYRHIVESDLEMGRIPIGGSDSLAWYGDLAQAKGMSQGARKAYRMAALFFEDGFRPASMSPLPTNPVAEAHLRAARNLLATFTNGSFLNPPREILSRAIRHYRRALEVSPKSLDTRLALARATYLTGEKEEALAMLKEMRSTALGKALSSIDDLGKELADLGRGIRPPLPKLPSGQSRTLPLPRR